MKYNFTGSKGMKGLGLDPVYYAQNVELIIKLQVAFVAVLGRDPSDQEITNWVTGIKSGSATIQNAIDSLFLSPEYKAKHPDMNYQALIDASRAYQGWSTTTNPPAGDGKITPEQNAGLRAQLKAIWLSMLGHDLSELEYQNWIKGITSGQATIQNAIDSITMSAEYQKKHQGGEEKPSFLSGINPLYVGGAVLAGVLLFGRKSIGQLFGKRGRK